MRKEIALISLVIAFSALSLIARGYITPPDSWDFRGYYNVTNVNFMNVSDLNVSGTLIGNGSRLYDVNSTVTERDPLWTANMSSYYNKSYVYNKTEADSKFVDVSGDTMTGALHMGNSEVDQYIYFYEDGSTTGEYLKWETGGSDRFELSDSLDVAGLLSCDSLYSSGYVQALESLFSDSDIYTTGSGDDFWLGTSIQANANFRAYANGTLNFVDGQATGNLTVEGVKFEADTSHRIYDNATCVIIEGDTARIEVC